MCEELASQHQMWCVGSRRNFLAACPASPSQELKCKDSPVQTGTRPGPEKHPVSAAGSSGSTHTRAETFLFFCEIQEIINQTWQGSGISVTLTATDPTGKTVLSMLNPRESSVYLASFNLKIILPIGNLLLGMAFLGQTGDMKFITSSCSTPPLG